MLRTIDWWLRHIWMRLRGDRGCGGEGWTITDQGELKTCYRRGCH